MCNNFFHYKNEELFKTQEWLNNVIKFHYPKKSLPSWVNIEKFYDQMKEDLMEKLKDAIIKGDKCIDIRELFFQLNSRDVSDDEVETISDFCSIPDCVIKEFFDYGFFDEEIDNLEIVDEKSFGEWFYDISSLKEDDTTEFQYFNIDTMKVIPTHKKTDNTLGIMKPVKLSKEMSEFCGWNEDTLHSRIDVTKCLCNYIKNNKLFNPDKKTEIIPDEKLGLILGCNNPLTYFDIQRLIQKHYLDHIPLKKSKRSSQGFLKPMMISKELTEFCGWELDTLHSRVEISKSIFKYIKDNKLYDPYKSPEIFPDVKLTILLDYNRERDGSLTYTNIQKYLQMHYIL